MPLIYYRELIFWENPSCEPTFWSLPLTWGSVLGRPGEPICTSAGKPLSSLLVLLQPSDDSPHRPTQTHRQLASPRPPPLRHPSAGSRAGFMLAKLPSGSLHVHCHAQSLSSTRPGRGLRMRVQGLRVRLG